MRLRDLDCLRPVKDTQAFRVSPKGHHVLKELFGVATESNELALVWPRARPPS